MPRCSSNRSGTCEATRHEYLRTPSPRLEELLDESREALAVPSMKRGGGEEADDETKRRPGPGSKEPAP